MMFIMMTRKELINFNWFQSTQRQHGPNSGLLGCVLVRGIYETLVSKASLSNFTGFRGLVSGD